MAHATSRGTYRQLTGRLNRFPQGAPPSALLYRILEMLFSEREAGLVAQLPIKPFTANKAAEISVRTSKETCQLAQAGRDAAIYASFWLPSRPRPSSPRTAAAPWTADQALTAWASAADPGRTASRSCAPRIPAPSSERLPR